jgi:hypothetical protein
MHIKSEPLGIGCFTPAMLALQDRWRFLGDASTAEKAEKEWYANADDIAVYLSGINPYWDEQQWRSMLHAHLALTKAEAEAMLAGDYQGSIQIYDEIERQALAMADTISSGIMKQFPRKNIYG